MKIARALFSMCAGSGLLMTKDKKKRMAAVVRATEYLFLENIALKLVLEHRAVPNCKSYWRNFCRTKRYWRVYV
jgi:hypothetical protein